MISVPVATYFAVARMEVGAVEEDSFVNGIGVTFD